MFPEDRLLPVSALQHLVFCERQWALIHLEQQWEENPLTLGGHFLHERVELPGTESRGALRVATALPLRSLRLGLVGKADRVEFHRAPSGRPGDECPEKRRAIAIPGISGLWSPVPVEYKHGRPKTHGADRIQLCAQALCLEEMLDVEIPEGRLYYGKTRKRVDVPFTPELREETEKSAARLHQLTIEKHTPPARYEPKCDSCSLIDLCLPRITQKEDRSRRYLQKHLTGLRVDEEGS